MPGIVKSYSAGTVIYSMGDPGNSVCILKSGSVSLVHFSIDTGEEVSDTIREGELFGTVAALAGRPRDETAISKEEAQVLAFSTEEFEKFLTVKTAVAGHIFRAFVGQLRKVRKLHTSFTDSPDTHAKLFQTGEYYLKNRKLGDARYVYEAYLRHFGREVYAAQARERLERIAESVGGKGADPETRAPGAAPPAEAVPEEKRATVLVIDDYVETLELLRRVIEKEGYGSILAKDGERGLSYAQSDLPDIIVLERLLPVMNGIQVVRRLKEREETRHIPVIFLSILDSERDIIEGLKAGADDYITKPFSPDELMARIDRILARCTERSRREPESSV